MYGVVTRNEPELHWAEFDRAFFEVKDVTGRAVEPESAGVSMISCFGDNAAAEGSPALVPVSEDGARATREEPYFDWAYICPNKDDYRAGILEMIEDAVEVNPDLRLDDVGFPRPEYCHCEDCNERFAASEFEDRTAWRAQVITDFVEEATELIPGKTYFTLYPDPYPGHLYDRAGIDIEAIEPYVDEFVVPLYDMAYETTYWLETIAKGFQSRLETPFSVELYAVDIDIDNLIHAAEVAAEYGETVLFGYDASNARAAIRRQQADDQEGVSHGN